MITIASRYSRWYAYCTFQTELILSLGIRTIGEVKRQSNRVNDSLAWDKYFGWDVA